MQKGSKKQGGKSKEKGVQGRLKGRKTEVRDARQRKEEESQGTGPN